MRYLGLDLGTKSLGISITDKSNTFVRPFGVLKFKSEDYGAVIPELKKIIAENNVGTVVLGLPKNMDGSMGFASKRSLDFKSLLAENGIEVELMDERLTTKEAENIIHANMKNIKNTKDTIDAIAASIILESYIRKGQNETKEQ